MTTYAALSSQLQSHVSGEVRFDDMMRVLYSTDASNYQVYPAGVVLPKTADDIVAAVQLCAEHGVPVIPRGGGSGLCGQSIGAGVVIDTTKYMNRLLELDAHSRQVRVEPGMILSMLNKQLAASGLQFGPDPASAERAAVGGVIGTNATGAHSIRYGMTSDHVTALRCVMDDGSVETLGPIDLKADGGRAGQIAREIASLVGANSAAIRRDFPGVWRRASGYNVDYIAEMLAYDPLNPAAALMPANTARRTSNYDNHLRQISRFNLAPLIAGAEGSLAMVLDATLNLVPKPKCTGLAVASFKVLDDAMRATPALLSTDPSAVELIGEMLIKLARDLPEYARRMGWVDVSAGVPEAVLAIEFDGETPAEVEAGLARLQRVVDAERMPCTITLLRDAASQADVWAVRKVGLAILMSIRSDFKPISVVEDIAVPVAHLAEFVRDLRACFAEQGVDGALYGHASAGCLHVRPLVNLKTADGVRIMHAIGNRALALCLRYGAAMSGEHGDGYERTRWNPALFGGQVAKVFEGVKRIFDPKRLFNPNKKVHGLDMDDRMRFGPDYRTLPFSSTFTFQKDGSLAALAEQCNGSGVCRKLDSGVMCPSYRVTLDETHSTRGRANLLREMLADRGRPKLTVSEDDVKQALDLCLSCKACESECASGVDMAKMKSDFTARIYEQRGVPLRAFVFGRIAALSALAAPVAPLANWMLGQSWLKRALHLAPDRDLPAFARSTFMSWWRRHTPEPASAARGEVALFVDTFTRYNHPEIGVAAVQVLERAGYSVVIPPWECCGRPMISQGQPGAARGQAEANVRHLLPYAQRGVPILGLEPSCISALKDDYLDLLPGPDTKAVASVVQPVEDFLNAQGAVPDHSGTGAVVYHGHCHQKAGWNTSGSKQALQQAGYAVSEINSTCCGMAGAFGYEAEHADISRRVGELSVLPGVRAASPGAIIAAPGTSCRQQIELSTGRRALHPIEVMALALQRGRDATS